MNVRPFVYSWVFTFLNRSKFISAMTDVFWTSAPVVKIETIFASFIIGHFYVYYSIVLYLVIWNETIAWSNSLDVNFMWYHILTVSKSMQQCIKEKGKKHSYSPTTQVILLHRWLGPQKVASQKWKCSLSPNCKIQKYTCLHKIFGKLYEWCNQSIHADPIFISLPIYADWSKIYE